MAPKTYDLIVIGEGVSGLACAGHARRAGLSVATFESNLFGGLVLNVNELDGYPGSESGTLLASELMQANSDAGVASIQEEVTAVSSAGGGFEIAAGGVYGARQVVIASGARLKKLGVPGEREFEGRGVSSCADCDAPMFQNEEVVVVGGGDSALQEALVLAKFCSRVHIVHRGDRLRAQKHLVERADADPRISFMWKSTVEAVLGAKMVEKVRVRRNGTAEEIAAVGVFAYVGLEPNSACAPSGSRRDGHGHLVTNDAFETSMPGVWAIGAVRAGYSGLLRDAASEAQRVAEAVRDRLD
ncbi:MAG TPA: FAD-dependent oxidoreductase [Burkholderiales bacterium]|nr:FAD-dependent oxidoreductase [Burkholderiales bacterium]